MSDERDGARAAVPVRVLYFEGCPNHPPTVERVRAVAERAGVAIDLRETEVGPNDDPQQLGFRGSPTVQVNGVELDPAERGRDDCGFGCRTYGGTGVPDEAMIEAALRNPPHPPGEGGPSSDRSASAPHDPTEPDCCSPSPSTSGDEGQAGGGRMSAGASLAALGSAIAASACCWLPLLAVGVGLSLSLGGLIAVFETARPYLLAAAAVCLAVAFYAVYFRHRRCTPGMACATGRSKPGGAPQAALWFAAVGVGALALFPYYSGALWASGPAGGFGSEVAGGRDDAAPTAGARVYEIEGMTCGGCEAAVCGALREVPGVKACGASYERGRVWIVPGAVSPKDAAILDAIERAGFTRSPADS